MGRWWRGTVAFVVVYDACVLYPMPLADSLIRLAQTGVFRACWSDDILDECVRALKREHPNITEEAVARRRKGMIDAVRDCLVEGYEDLVAGLKLPDANDRHVLAAAITAGAQVIVTANVKDFPKAQVGKYNIDAQSPDTFIKHVISMDPGVVLRVLREQVAPLKNPPLTVEQLLGKLEGNGLVGAVAELRAQLAQGPRP
jgi:predicted nucleic acid-binding protein